MPRLDPIPTLLTGLVNAPTFASELSYAPVEGLKDAPALMQGLVNTPELALEPNYTAPLRLEPSYIPTVKPPSIPRPSSSIGLPDVMSSTQDLHII